jgi:Ca2+/Na+ antiporter
MIVPLSSTGDISTNSPAELLPGKICAPLQEKSAGDIGCVPAFTKLSDNKPLTDDTPSRSDSAQLERDSYGKRVIDGFLEINRLVIYIAGLGASFIFSSIISQLQTPSNSFDTEKVRLFLSVSWLLFLVALGLACLLTLLLIFNAVEVAERWRKDKKWAIGTFVVCMTILFCLIGAYSCIGLVLIAYEFWVGIIGFCVGGLLFLTAIVLGVIQLYRELTVDDNNIVKQDLALSSTLVG